MKKVHIAVLAFIILSCSKSDPTTDAPPTNVSVLIQPNQTDEGYASTDQAHYVIRNTKTHLNKMLLFIGGSFSVPKDYTFITDHAATIGLDVISLSYPNLVAAASLGTSTDPLVFDKYREELNFGNPVSNDVSVDVLNSINTRATKLVIYLKATFPDQNWGQYLTSSNTLQWDKIIVAGHSQGSGHACYIAKKNVVSRVVMFSGPNDYSTNFSAPANWLAVVGQTPTTKHYALLHTQDEIVPFNYQVANVRGLGMLTSAQTPLLVDNLTAPFSNAHALSLNISALSFHNSTIGGNSKLPAIWTYLFTSN